jgi:hypothetical protein
MLAEQAEMLAKPQTKKKGVKKWTGFYIF